MTQVSLRDVALRAGVSFQTAGKVLNGAGRVSPATRERILAAADELGYVPNSVARSLKRRRTNSIGFIGSGLESYVLAPLMRGVEQEATARGYFAVFTLASGEGDHIDGLVQQLLERRVDGLINAALAHRHYPPLGDLLRQSVPCVNAISDLPGFAIVRDNAVQTARLVWDHLSSLGHRRAAVIADYPVGPEFALNPRLAAIADAMGIVPGDPWWDRSVAHAAWTAESAAAAMTTLLDRDPDLTAVFTMNDHMAAGALATLRARGRRVPEDVSVVGCDDTPLASYLVPPLTTVRISFEEIGAAATRLLLSRLESTPASPPEAQPAAERDPEPVRELLPVELVARASTGPAPR